MSVNTSTITTHKFYPPQVSCEDSYYPSTDPNSIPETDVHFIFIANLILILRNFLENRTDANVFGDIMFYYESGNSKKFVAPDVMICFDINKSPHRVYKLSDEKSVPPVIIEIASENTWREDLTRKFAFYQSLGVKEYYVFDPEYKYLAQPLLSFHLNKNGELIEKSVKQGRILSKILDLEFVDTGETLRFFNPKTKDFLMTLNEIQTEMSEIQGENEKLKAELAKLKNNND